MLIPSNAKMLCMPALKYVSRHHEIALADSSHLCGFNISFYWLHPSVRPSVRSLRYSHIGLIQSVETFIYSEMRQPKLCHQNLTLHN